MALGGSTAVLERPPLALVRSHRARRGPRWLPWWPAAYGAVVGALLFLLARGSLSDDADISLSFARNVSQGCWCLTAGVPADTATSPLNVWLLAALTWVTDGRALVAVGLLLVATMAVGAWLLHRLGGWLPAVAGPLLLATSPVLSSSLGLETYLAGVVLLALVTAGVERRVFVCGVLCGAAALTRPDMAVTAVVAVLVLAAGTRNVRLLLALPIGALVALPWHVATWFAFGSAVPTTLPVKASQSGWGPGGTVHLTNSLPMYLQTWPAATWLTVATLAVGVLSAAVAVDRRWWDAVALAAGGAADLAVMAATASSPVGYYFGPAVAGLGLCAVLVAVRARWPLPALVVLIVACLVFTIVRWPSWERGYAPIRQNWATSGQYVRIASELPTDGVVLSEGEIGALALYCQDRRCTVVDRYLADPGRTNTYVQKWRGQHPGLEANWRHYQPPTPLRVRYRLDFGRLPGNPADNLRLWPVTGADGTPGWAALRWAN